MPSLNAKPKHSLTLVPLIVAPEREDALPRPSDGCTMITRAASITCCGPGKQDSWNFTDWAVGFWAGLLVFRSVGLVLRLVCPHGPVWFACWVNSDGRAWPVPAGRLQRAAWFQR